MHASAAHLAGALSDGSTRQTFYDSVALWPALSVLLSSSCFPPLFSLFVSFYRETVVRLQSENKMLCVQEETYRQKVVEVQAELEDAQRSKNALETQNR